MAERKDDTFKNPFPYSLVTVQQNERVDLLHSADMVYRSAILTALVEHNLVNIETIICIKILRSKYHI
jgi:hypothetical protein